MVEHVPQAEAAQGARIGSGGSNRAGAPPPALSSPSSGDPLLANFRKMAATQAKIYAAGWGAMNDTVREERGLVQSTKL